MEAILSWNPLITNPYQIPTGLPISVRTIPWKNCDGFYLTEDASIGICTPENLAPLHYDHCRDTVDSDLFGDGW